MKSNASKKQKPSVSKKRASAPADSTSPTKQYPTGAELLEKAEKALQEESKLDVTALDNMTKGLSDLAEKAVKGNKFTEEQAKQELSLREQFLKVTKSFFASRLERGMVLMEYQRFYTPLGMLSDFLKVADVDRRTAYRWIDLAKSAKSGKSNHSPIKHRLDSSMVPKVKEIISSVKRAIKGLDEDDQKDVLRAVSEWLTDYRKNIGKEPLKIEYVEAA
jgi:hypothetical protein